MTELLSLQVLDETIQQINYVPVSINVHHFQFSR